MYSVAGEHEFIRYVSRPIGANACYQALCSCGWRSLTGGRASTWSDWNSHRHSESFTFEAGLKQALTGQEP